MKKKVLVIVANSYPFYCSIAKHIELDHIENGDHVEVFNYEKLCVGTDSLASNTTLSILEELFIIKENFLSCE